MKALFLLALFPFAAGANFSAGDVKFVKVLDGKTLYCNSDRAVGGRGYIPSEPKASALDSAIELSFNVNSVLCVKVADRFVFAPIGLNEPMPDQDIYGNPIVRHIILNEAILVGSNIRLLGKREMENLPTQRLTARFELANLMNEAQRKALDDGMAIQVRVEYFQLMGIVVETSEKKIPIGQRAGGSFAFLFQVKKSASGQLEVSAVKIQ
jgi:hypothetical protein